MIPVNLRLFDRPGGVDRPVGVLFMPQVPQAGEYVHRGDETLIVHSVAWRFGKLPSSEELVADALKDQWFATVICRPVEGQPIPPA
jgi:hypothetical protein